MQRSRCMPRSHHRHHRPGHPARSQGTPPSSSPASSAREDPQPEPESEPSDLSESLAQLSISGPGGVSISAGVAVVSVQTVANPADRVSREYPRDQRRSTPTASGVGASQPSRTSTSSRSIRGQQPSVSQPERVYVIWVTPGSSENLVGVHSGPRAWPEIARRLQGGSYLSGRDRLAGVWGQDEAFRLFHSEAQRHGVQSPPTVFRWE